MPFQKIESEKLASAVVRQIEGLILQGILRPESGFPQSGNCQSALRSRARACARPSPNCSRSACSPRARGGDLRGRCAGLCLSLAADPAFRQQ